MSNFPSWEHAGIVVHLFPKWELDYAPIMKLLGKNVLITFMMKHADARKKVESLVAEIEGAEWSTPHDVKKQYPTASIIGNQNVVFNVRGNRYRIHVRVAYRTGRVLVIQAGTHQEYDAWNIE